MSEGWSEKREHGYLSAVGMSYSSEGTSWMLEFESEDYVAQIIEVTSSCEMELLPITCISSCMAYDNKGFLFFGLSEQGNGYEKIKGRALRNRRGPDCL